MSHNLSGTSPVFIWNSLHFTRDILHHRVTKSEIMYRTVRSSVSTGLVHLKTEYCCDDRTHFVVEFLRLTATYIFTLVASSFQRRRVDVGKRRVEIDCYSRPGMIHCSRKKKWSNLRRLLLSLRMWSNVNQALYISCSGVRSLREVTRETDWSCPPKCEWSSMCLSHHLALQSPTISRLWVVQQLFQPHSQPY